MGYFKEARREIGITDLTQTFDLWAQELSTRLKLPVKILMYDDIGEMRRAFQRREIDGVSTDAMTLMRNFRQDEFGNGYSIDMLGGWNLTLLSAKDASIRGLNDLVGKRIAILEGDQTSVMYLETVCLRHYSRECSKVFADIQHVPSNNLAIMRVFFGKADLALAYRHGYELAKEMNPQLAKKLGGVLGELPLTSLYFAFFNARVDKEFQKRVLSVISTLHTDPRGRQLLDILKMDQMRLAEPVELNPFVQLEKEYLELKSQAERQKGRK